MLTIREYTHEFYPIAARWWKAHGWTPIPQDVLPPIGLIVYSDTAPVAVVWMYQTDRAFVWMEWLVSNPDFKDKQLRGDALNMLIDEFKKRAKAIGYSRIITSVKNKHLMARLENSGGFVKTDENMTNYIGVI